MKTFTEPVKELKEFETLSAGAVSYTHLPIHITVGTMVSRLFLRIMSATCYRNAFLGQG